MKGCVQIPQRLEVKLEHGPFRLLFLFSFHIVVVLKCARKFLDSLLFQKESLIPFPLSVGAALTHF